MKLDDGFQEQQPNETSYAQFMSMLLDAIAAVQAGQKATTEQQQATNA
ncbi:MAG TPA: hypothetical protein PL106_09615 [Flavobacteriales bacterium]|nr:hypothetical protein [Flavobacteriales bacterium]HNA33365.1 hypothetical protein [Flavobacteriales bacterium]